MNTRNASTRSSVVEFLESRTLLSGSSLSGGVLRVNGDLNHRNVIRVTSSDGGQSVSVSIESYNVLNVLTGTHTHTYSKAQGINSIRVRGGFAADDISVGQDSGAGPLDLDTRVLSLAGDDRVRTNGGNDVVFAGAGNDDVNAGNGNNWVRGEAGNDLLVTGDGFDRVAGGIGNDMIGTGAGDDVVLGQGGNDAIDAGVGNDLVFGHTGNDAVGGGDGNDVVFGGLGDDIVTGGNGNDKLGGFFGSNSLTGGAGADTFLVAAQNSNLMDFILGDGDVVTQVGAKADGGSGPAV